MKVTQKEPLKELANFSFHWAQHFCSKSCLDYHKNWSTARLLASGGKFPGHVDYIGTKIKEYLHNAQSDQKNHLVISGAADTGLLMGVIKAIGKNHHNIEIFVIDQCQTVLKQHELLIQHLKLNNVKLVQEDILKNSIRQVDIVIAHSFLNFFTPPQQIKLFKKWFDMLKPKGLVIIHQKTVESTTKIEKKIATGKVEKSLPALLKLGEKMGLTNNMVHSIQKFWINQPILKPITKKRLNNLINKTGFSVKDQISTTINPQKGPLAIRYQNNNRLTQLLVLKK